MGALVLTPAVTHAATARPIIKGSCKITGVRANPKFASLISPVLSVTNRGNRSFTPTTTLTFTNDGNTTNSVIVMDSVAPGQTVSKALTPYIVHYANTSQLSTYSVTGIGPEFTCSRSFTPPIFVSDLIEVNRFVDNSGADYNILSTLAILPIDYKSYSKVPDASFYAYKSKVKGTLPVHEFRKNHMPNSYDSTPIYTNNTRKIAQLNQDPAWSDLGIVFYAFNKSSEFNAPVYVLHQPLFNGNPTNQLDNSVYTANQNEITKYESYGYTNQGPAFYIPQK